MEYIMIALPLFIKKKKQIIKNVTRFPKSEPYRGCEMHIDKYWNQDFGNTISGIIIDTLSHLLP